MSPAVWSLLALLLALALSMVSRINVGVVALALAWLVGIGAASLSAAEVVAGFPVGLFVTLAGVSLLFACAEDNGTLEVLAYRSARVAARRSGLLPILVFALACALSALGPGGISAVALLAPLAMSMSRTTGASPLLMALMVCNGANAGNLSPVSAVGVIANHKMAEAGLAGHAGLVFFANFAAHVAVAAGAYLLFGRRASTGRQDPAPAAAPTAPSFAFRQRLTAGLVALWILGVLVFALPLGLSAFAAAGLLLLLRAADEKGAFARAPWGVVLMVCGVSTLIALLERTGGMELFASLIARLATPQTLNGTIALVVGLISTYSSTSGVVLPAFLPTAARLTVEAGGGDPLAVALSINVGSALVDVSPLSTLGALCIATQHDPRQAQVLFRQLLLWAFAMVVVGAVLAQLGAGFLARL